MNNILSYAQFLKDRADFRKSGSKHSHEFNFYDTPSHKFFKINETIAPSLVPSSYDLSK